jgi:serine/threonine-protein kinase
MGEVYRARDTKLNRDVALKVLPPEFALDPDRVARFKREAQVLASLDHPNIGSIYGFEDTEGIQALVLQLVEGPTLADRIAHAPLPLDDALPIARQTAKALEAAHEQGIIHRDLKPANIKLRPDGTVKVLDFGLAKLLDTTATTGEARAYSPELTHSPTITTPAMTQLGVILGTAAYMSPEQAKGRPADKRGDIWAFGCVLYEMLAGKRAFEGEDVSETLAAVIKSEPDWAALPEDVPTNVVRLLRRCLRKDPQERLPHIAIAGYEVDEPPTLQAESTRSFTRVMRLANPWTWAIAVFIILVSAVPLVLWLRTRSPTQAPILTRFELTLPDSQQITDPQHRSVAISPDGTRIVYVANRRLYLRSMSDPLARLIATDGSPAGGSIGSPVFSPDGRSIAYVSALGGQGAAIKRIDINGGASITVAKTDSNNVLGLSWSGDDILFADNSNGLVRISAASGKQQVLIRSSANEFVQGPTMLPGGEVVLFALGTRRGPGNVPTVEVWDTAKIIAYHLRTGARKTLIEGGSDPHYLPTGHLLYALSGTMFVVPFDPRALEVTGERVPILNGVARTIVARTATGMAQFAISGTGSAVYIAGPAAATADQPKLVLVDRAGKMEPLKLPPGFYERPRISPNGKQLAFGSEETEGAVVWVYDLFGNTAPRQLTFEGKNLFPIWSADGQRVAFQSDRDGDGAIFWQRSDGTTKAERLTKPDAGTSHVPEMWSPDGQHLLYTVEKGGTNFLWVYSMDRKKGEPIADVQSPRLISAAFSPDGRWIAYTVTTGGTNRVFVQPFPTTGVRFLIGTGARPQWSPDGKELLFYNTDRTFVATVTTRPTFATTPPVALPFNVFGGRGPGFGRDADIFPNGQRFVAVVASPDTTLRTGVRQLEVVLNWFTELQQRVPAK